MPRSVRSSGIQVSREDIGSSVMYRDFYMSGWSARDVTIDDVRLEPMISGRGKLCRLMATMGVARGIGDHGLMVKSSCVSCKEFLTCQPEIRTLDLRRDCDGRLTGEEYLVMGTDGLWDVMKNSDVHQLIADTLTSCGSGAGAKNSPTLSAKEPGGRYDTAAAEEEDVCQEIAKRLVLCARGERVPDMYWEKKNGDLASGDDITVLTISLKEMLAIIISSGV